MNIPAKYREAVYWVVLVCTVVVGVLSGLNLVPQDAVVRGGETVLQLLTVIGAILALKNITPDE
jgi:hypothetical protein